MPTHFFLLPVVTCIALWLVKKLIGFLSRSKSAPQILTNHAPTEDQTLEQATCLEICDFEFRLPVGDCADAIILALVARDLPGFHHSLRTADGLPVRAAWIKNLVTGDFSVGAAHPSELDATVQRALLLALDALQSIALRVSESNPPEAILHVHFLAPARWGVDTLKAAEQWLLDGFESTMLPLHTMRVSVNPVHDSRGVYEYLNGLNTQINKEHDDANHLLLVSDSFIEDVPIALRRDNGTPYEIDPLEGDIPGEGASALLLRHPSLKRSSATSPRVADVVIHPHDALSNNRPCALSVLLDRCNVAEDSVGTVITDSSHHAEQQAEVDELQREFFRELHPIQDCLFLTSACGEMGAVAPLASLGLAAHLNVSSQKDCVVVAGQDGEWRAAALVFSSSVEARAAHNEPD